MAKSFEVSITMIDGKKRVLPVIAQTSCDAIFAVLTALGDAALDAFGPVAKVRAQSMQAARAA